MIFIFCHGIIYPRIRRRILLTFLNNDIKLKIKRVFDTEIKGDKVMTDNEKELINLIRENDNSGRALMTATVIILGYLKLHGSSEAPASVDLRAHV